MENRWKNLPLAVIEMNDGQIKGLPRNPRTWTYDDVERLKASISETPELLKARGLIVVEHKDKYVVIGGNLRYTALKALGYAEAPCYVLPEATPLKKVKEIVIKDNGSFGDWDFDLIKADWSDTPFVDWGIHIPDFVLDPDNSFFEGMQEGEHENGVNDGGCEDSNLMLFEVVMLVDEFMFVKDRLTYAGNADTIESGLLKLIGYTR